MIASRLLRRLKAPLRDVRGATAIEYGLIVAVIACGLIVAIAGLANVSVGTLANVSTAMSTPR